MLIDYLEEIALYMSEKEGKYQKLEREYQRIYEKDLRQEMKIIKKEIAVKKHELIESVYENIEEYRLLSKNFPELFGCFLEEGTVGKALKRKKWLLEFNPIKNRNAEKELQQVKNKKKQLEEARKTVLAWVGRIKAKQFEATFSILKGRLKKDLDKDEVLDIIHGLKKEIRLEGWKIALNEPVIEKIFDRMMARLKKTGIELKSAKIEYEKSKGKGSVAEYESMKKVEELKKTFGKYERFCRHILMANNDYLNKLKNKKPGEFGENEPTVRRILADIKTKKINEMQWMEKMKQRLETK